MNDDIGDGVMRQVSIERFFTDNQARLGLRWVAGRQGGSKVLSGDTALKPTIGQVGHMNFIHPFRIQILGAAELAWLRALADAEATSWMERLFTAELAAVIVANGAEGEPGSFKDRKISPELGSSLRST